MNQLDQEQVDTIIECGKILNSSLKKVVESVKPGISTLELDSIAEKYIRDCGAVPAFKNYHVDGVGTYPATLCVSINDEIVHGIPNKNRIIENGDIVSLDIGAGLNGIYTDMATTVAVGDVSKEIQQLLKVTEECLYIGIDQALPGRTTGDIGYAIQKHAESYGFGVVRSLVGHGIGTEPHCEPQVPNYGRMNSGHKLKLGEAIAIEPMITLGDWHIKTSRDQWTISTADGSISAHFEHTVVITKDGPLVVTAQ